MPGPNTRQPDWTRDCVRRWQYNRAAVDTLLAWWNERFEGQAVRAAIGRGIAIADDVHARWRAGDDLDANERDGLDAMARFARNADLLVRLGWLDETEPALADCDPRLEPGDPRLDVDGQLRPIAAVALVSGRMRGLVQQARNDPRYLTTTGRRGSTACQSTGPDAGRVADSRWTSQAIVDACRPGGFFRDDVSG